MADWTSANRATIAVAVMRPFFSTYSTRQGLLTSGGTTLYYTCVDTRGKDFILDDLFQALDTGHQELAGSGLNFFAAKLAKETRHTASQIRQSLSKARSTVSSMAFFQISPRISEGGLGKNSLAAVWKHPNKCCHIPEYTSEEHQKSRRK